MHTQIISRLCYAIISLFGQTTFFFHRLCAVSNAIPHDSLKDMALDTFEAAAAKVNQSLKVVGRLP